MNRISKYGCLVSIGISALPCGAIGQTAPASGAQAATDAGQISEIIVTAQRREERAQSVPISITTFAPERIQQMNITESQDLQGSVPSLVVGSNGQGSRDTQSFTIRGQGATFQASPGVVVYFDEVPLPAPVAFSQQGGPGNYVDLENIQVLKGPQGTLFGRNTTGGAVLLVPHKAVNDFAGSLLTKFGNYSDREFEGVLNVPVVNDKLLVRLVGAYHDRDGYTRDVIHNADLDNVHWYSGRLTVTFRPTDSFENNLVGYASYSRNHGTGMINQGFNIPGLEGVGFCVDPPLSPPGPSGIAISCNYYRNLTKEADALGPRATAPGSDPGLRTLTWGFIDTARIDLTDEIALRNIASYQLFESHIYYDGDATVAQQYDPSLPINPLPRDYYEDITEEFQLQGTLLDQHLAYTAGFFYYDQRPVGAQGFTEVVYCPGLFTGFCAPEQGLGSVETQSKALYAQSAFDFGALMPSLDGLKLTGGVRYTWDTITGVATAYTPNTSGGFVCANSGAVVPSNPAANCGFSATLHSAAPTWNVGLDYKVSDDTLVYGKISRGYKAGGFNPYAVFSSTETFDPEYVTSYEAGFKSDFHVGTVPARLNGTYYYLDYDNIQRAAGDYNPATNSSGARILSAKARVQGIELEATIRPVQQVEIGAAFSYTDFKYTDYKIPANGLPDCSGKIPAPGTLSNLDCLAGQYVSPYIFNVHASYTQPLPNDMGELVLFANYAYSSGQHTEAIVVPPGQPGEFLGSFGLLNMSLDWNDIAGSGVDAGLWATNATNTLYRISNTDVFQVGSLLGRSATYGEPAMYGLRLRYHFENAAVEPETAATTYVPPPVQAPAPASKSYLVFFDFNKSDLSPQAVQIVDTAAENASLAKVTEIAVTGHTDTVGSDAYNMRLSRRRAESVAVQLEKDGVPSSEIEIVAKGKRDLLVPTKDGVREPQNRRVQIVLGGSPGA